MGKHELKKDISSIYSGLEAGITLPGLVDKLFDTLKKHPDAISDTTYSYRICASDTGFSRSFSIKSGVVSEMDELDEADVIVTGTEANLLAVLTRKLSPMSAMLRGKVKIKGSMPALIRFAEFI